VAGGSYDLEPDFRAFVVAQHGGVWGNAVDVPGLAALGSSSGVSSVSCASAGNCAAGGSYEDGSGGLQVFVVSERGGVWGTAIEVPGLAALNTERAAWVTSVSCATPGNCAAGGVYWGAGGNFHAFVVSEKNGTWGTAFDLGGDSVDSVSCGGPGDCVAVGSTPGVARTHAFLAVEKDGTWTKGIGVPGLGALSHWGGAQARSVSCVSPGNCTAIGVYSYGYRGFGDDYYGFVVEEKNGIWGRATKLPGALGQFGDVTSVSCASPGNCALGGTVASYPSELTAFVMSEKHGKWNPGKGLMQGEAAQDGEGPIVNAVSCASAGNCAAVGYYDDGDPDQARAFVVAERNGVWGTWEDVPGTDTLGGYGRAYSVSCASAGNCAIGGASGDVYDSVVAFVTSP